MDKNKDVLMRLSTETPEGCIMVDKKQKYYPLSRNRQRILREIFRQNFNKWFKMQNSPLYQRYANDASSGRYRDNSVRRSDAIRNKRRWSSSDIDSLT